VKTRLETIDSCPAPEADYGGPVHTEAVLSLLQEVAAEVITPRFRALGADEVAEKNPGDLVTVADHEAEARLTEVLRAAYPGALVLGEEAYAADNGLLRRFAVAGHAFCIDPLDGTKNFVAGSPDHAVMVAELRGGRTVRAWIWQPQHRRAYVAEQGAGAYRDGTRLHREPPGPVEEWRGRTSRRRRVGERLGGLPALALSWASCGIDYPQLVEGAADYVLYGRGKPWDHAPGSLLLAEAGGFTGTLGGGAYRPDEVDPAPIIAAADRATYDVVAGLAAS
jgi:fructose-1,6-bisphosphatase/inositol monophosphatase family enzyme